MQVSPRSFAMETLEAYDQLASMNWRIHPTHPKSLHLHLLASQSFPTSLADSEAYLEKDVLKPRENSVGGTQPSRHPTPPQRYVYVEDKKAPDYPFQGIKLSNRPMHPFSANAAGCASLPTFIPILQTIKLFFSVLLFTAKTFVWPFV